MKKTLKKIIKYSSIFLTSTLVIVPVSLYTWYRVEYNQFISHSNINSNTYWNKDRTLFTLEGLSPQLFSKDNDRFTSNDQNILYSHWEYGNISERLNENVDQSVDNWVYAKKNIQNTTYLFKNKNEFINLFLKINPNYYKDANFINKEFKELLDTVDFSQKDIILLNNYITTSMPGRGDRRKLGWDIKNYNYNDSTKTLKLNWDKNYQQNHKYTWIGYNNIWVSDKALGSNYWYRSFFIIVDKTNLSDYKDLKVEMEYEWLK